MKAKPALPERVRSMEGLGVTRAPSASSERSSRPSKSNATPALWESRHATGYSRLRRISEASARQARFKVPHATIYSCWPVADRRSHTTSVQAARPAGWRAAHLCGGSDEWKLDNTLLMSTFVSEKKNAKHKLTEFARIQAGFRGATP